MSQKNEGAFLLDESTLPILERIAEGIPGGFFIYHADGGEELIYINQAMPRIFGCESKEEFLVYTDNSFRGIVHPADLDAVERSIQKQISSNQFHLDYVEYRIIRKDGTIRWVEDYGHFMHTEAYGDIFYVFLDDATDRLMNRLSQMEKVNRELRNAYTKEAQYRRALLHDALMVFEIDVTRDEFRSSSAQLLEGKMAGLLDCDEIPHFERYSQFVSYWADHLPESDRRQYREFFAPERLKKCYENGDLEQIFDCWVTDAFGAERLIQYTVLLCRCDHTGNVLALAIIKDITDTREHRRLLERAWKQAKTASVARDVFLDSLSHDINTPLNGLLGCVDLMENHLDDKEKLLEYIARVRSFGEQLYTFWNESLELTRSQSGKVVVDDQECDFLDLLEELGHRARLKAQGNHLEFSGHWDGLKHHRVVTDPSQVREILWQLLDNAVKYTRPGGKVELTAEEAPAPEGFVKMCFTVSDTGIGMHEEFLTQLFQPFAREKDSTQSGVFGSGLGLSVAKNLTDLMGGTISVKSKLGVGSVFTVYLTFRLQEQAEPPPHPLETMDLRGMRVLLVEDNEINREIAEEFLLDREFIVDTANDGAAALQKVADSPPGSYDVVLMDIQMPVMNGYEASRAIRALKDPARAEIPIIALSANAFAENQKMSMEAGMDAHCSKPLDIQELCLVMTKVLGTQRAASTSRRSGS